MDQIFELLFLIKKSPTITRVIRVPLLHTKFMDCLTVQSLWPRYSFVTPFPILQFRVEHIKPITGQEVSHTPNVKMETLSCHKQITIPLLILSPITVQTPVTRGLPVSSDRFGGFTESTMEPMHSCHQYFRLFSGLELNIFYLTEFEQPVVCGNLPLNTRGPPLHAAHMCKFLIDL